MNRSSIENLSFSNIKTPEKASSSFKIRPKTATRVFPEVYHGSTIIHRTPGRHTDLSIVRTHSSKKFDLSRVQSSVLAFQHTPPQSKSSKKVSEMPEKNQRRIPLSKAEGEMILFREIFVKPREDQLTELKKLMDSENFGDLLFNKKLGVQKKAEIVEKEAEKPVLKELPEKSSFYDHQIQVQPPEGLNATIAAPLTPGGGWAPSIPPTIGSFKNLCLKDITLRAKSGMQAGDVQREAHMSYSIAVLNEDHSNFVEALKFYKRFFFCAKILDDPIGAALALNRLGIVYFNLDKTEKSISFHLKHAEFSDKENKFAAFYNLGIAYRHLNDAKEAIKYLTKALGWANKRNDLESQCITLGQLGLVFKMTGDYKKALQNLENSLRFAKSLKNQELQMETSIVLGILCYENNELEPASRYFHRALNFAKNLGKGHLADLCSCNLGIVDANLKFFDVQNKIMERCKSGKRII